jgi:hypothetical protein
MDRQTYQIIGAALEVHKELFLLSCMLFDLILISYPKQQTRKSAPHPPTRNQPSRNIDPFWALNNLVNGKSGVSADMAIRLDKAFGDGAETWLRLQLAYDLAQARRHEGEIKVKAVPRRKPLELLGDNPIF